MSISPGTRILVVALVLVQTQLRGTTTAASQAREEALLVTRTVNVDGLPIRVRVAGLANRRPGQAAVVFESGGSAPLETWDPVLPAVGSFAPVEPPRVPTSVIVAGRIAAPPSNLVSFDAPAYAKAMHQSQVRRLRSWAIDGGSFEVATNSGHVVHADDPERVIAAIRNPVTAGR